MATAVQQQLSYNPFPNQCEPDMESWLDLNSIASPTLGGPSRMPAATSPPSAITSPATTILPLDQADELQTPAKPSHEYERFKQQTGLPSNSVPGLQGPSNGFRAFSNSGIESWGSGLDFDSGMDMEMPLQNSGLPAFFYPPGDASQSDDFVDPSNINSQEDAQPAVRFWPGMHQQQAQQQALAKAQAQAHQQRQQQLLQQKQRMEQQQQQARGHQARRSASHQPTDARTEETIARVVNQIRQNSQLASQHGMSQHGNVLPQVIKMKKDEEDMDEDERLLASEEGKKLSSKERRQLRNKVSARAFRSRRKEYISQLEGEVAMKTNEANDLRIQNQALMEENARSRAFIEKLLRHPAFNPFLEDLSRDETINNKMPVVGSAAPSMAPTPAPQQQQQQFQEMTRQQNPQIGMALIPETPVDLSMLSLNNNWGMQNGGFNYQQPQVFAVMEVPEGPANPFNVEALSGKGYESVMDETAPAEEIKHDVPIIKSAPVEEKQVEAKPAETEEDIAFDNDPAFTLFHSAPSSPVTSAPQESVIVSEKPHFQLVVSEEASEAVMERFERMCARMEPVYQRIAAMTSCLDG